MAWAADMPVEAALAAKQRGAAPVQNNPGTKMPGPRKAWILAAKAAIGPQYKAYQAMTGSQRRAATNPMDDYVKKNPMPAGMKPF